MKELLNDFIKELSTTKKEKINEEINDIIYADFTYDLFGIRDLTIEQLNEINKKRQELKAIYDTIYYLEKAIYDFVEEEKGEKNTNDDGEFIETNGDGLIYKTKNAIYHLLEGKCSNGLSSDIVFIMREMEDTVTLDFVNYCYGSFGERNGIKEYVKEYERRMF